MYAGRVSTIGGRAGLHALAPVPAMLRKAVDPSKMTVRSVLTYPVKDLDGDWVNPTGGEWSPHVAANCALNLEHDPRAVVAWARESLDAPGAPHAVEMRQLDLGADGVWTLPVGTSYFKSSSQLSAQTFRLVDDDTIPGVSLEFKPDMARRGSDGRLVKAVEQLGTVSPINHRPSCRWNAWSGHGWAHCRRPVNPHAMTVKAEPDPAADRIARLLDTRRVGAEPAHPLILKALSKYAPARPAAVRGGWEVKAMGDPMDDDDTMYDLGGDGEPGDGMAPGMDEGDPNEPPAVGGVSALYSHAQKLEDAGAELADDLLTSDSPELRKAGANIKAATHALAAKAKAIADKHDAKLNGATGEDEDAPPEDADADGVPTDSTPEGEGDEPDGDEGEFPPAAADDDEDDETDMDKDEDGVLKGVRPPYYAVLKKARKVTAAHLDAPVARKAAPRADVDPAAVRAALDETRRNTAKVKRLLGL